LTNYEGASPIFPKILSVPFSIQCVITRIWTFKTNTPKAIPIEIALKLELLKSKSNVERDLSRVTMQHSWLRTWGTQSQGGSRGGLAKNTVKILVWSSKAQPLKRRMWNKIRRQEKEKAKGVWEAKKLTLYMELGKPVKKGDVT
jgi:hypothetical protein